MSIGDALGVPVEFRGRQEIAQDPVTDMRGYGTHNQPPGTFSDDSSLAFCLAEALTEEFNLQKIAANFIAWLGKGYWTAHGDVFDAGIATSRSIHKLSNGTMPELAGGVSEADNGNGSLMRILPLVLYIKDKPIGKRYEITMQVSAITHAHIRSIIACFYYLEFAKGLTEGKDKFSIYQTLQAEIGNHLVLLSINPEEIDLYHRLLNEKIYELTEKDIYSSGYVLHTLEAGIWCLLTTDTYKDAVLKAVNLGSDTDTTGAVTGGLAGLLYGFESIPQSWLAALARRSDIENLAVRLQKRMECLM